eukprot:CAMPEP_0182528828 /NCGR_PEP_ID=MMETSP1323-20130603/4769_1 /TAXON_ID=236787 /ORGANISM="Florenciella parvula, Strain RCC1693" /LENGTH=225 /DNA_ID=CAMNT_0024737995 /DNA_START=48 /DNA_END=725 /DNA_ORIENTATION=+
MGVFFVTVMLPILIIHCILVMHSFAPSTVETYITNAIALFIGMVLLLPAMHPANSGTHSFSSANGICIAMAIILSLVKCATMRSDRGDLDDPNWDFPEEPWDPVHVWDVFCDWLLPGINGLLALRFVTSVPLRYQARHKFLSGIKRMNTESMDAIKARKRAANELKASAQDQALFFGCQLVSRSKADSLPRRDTRKRLFANLRPCYGFSWGWVPPQRVTGHESKN